MEMIIKTMNFETTDTIEEYVKSKFKLLIVPEDMMKFHLTIEKHNHGHQKGQYELKFNTHYFQKEHHIENLSVDLYQGIDSLLKKVQRQMSEEKDQKHKHLHRQKQFV